MTFVRQLCAAAAFTLAATAALAQGAPSDAASAPAMSASMSQDCAKMMSRHDHGTDRNMPSAKSMGCAQTTAEKTSAPAKAKTAAGKHDHAKFHKNQ